MNDRPTVLAVAAHPDDIEFNMAGTLSLLVKAGSGALTLGVPSSPGVPASLAAHTLTLDYNIQRAAIDALGDRRGAVVGAFRVGTPVTHHQVGVEEPALYFGFAGSNNFDRTFAEAYR